MCLPLRSSLALTCALAGGLMAPASLLAATPNLSGTIVTTEKISADTGTAFEHRTHTKTVTVRWTLKGPVTNPGTASQAVSATPEILVYTDRVVATVNDETTCEERTFQGWVGGVLPSVPISFSMAAQDRLGRRSPAWVSLPWSTPEARGIIRSTDCGSAWSWGPIDAEQWLLVEHEQLTLSRAIIGEGGLQNMGSRDYLSPSWLWMRRGLAATDPWLSSGSRTLSGPGQPNGEAKSVAVSWNLRSTSPSTSCKLPTRKMVRGKPIRSVRSLLVKAGFRPGKKVAVGRVTGVKLGRVSGLASLTSSRTCGARVGYYYRSR